MENNIISMPICIDVWGKYACFTSPFTKVERYSYPVMTPSAARGVLNAIYSKPIEFYYEIEKIEIMNPIKRINIKTNEVTKKIFIKKTIKYIDTNNKHVRTQRNTNYLKDPYYRIYAKIVKRNDFHNRTITGIYAQFEKRIKQGKCFYQPYLGLRECVANFSVPDLTKNPININEELGIMTYDIFDIKNNVADDYDISLFVANIKDGVLNIPAYDSDEIRRISHD